MGRERSRSSPELSHETLLTEAIRLLTGYLDLSPRCPHVFFFFPLLHVSVLFLTLIQMGSTFLPHFPADFRLSYNLKKTEKKAAFSVFICFCRSYPFFSDDLADIESLEATYFLIITFFFFKRRSIDPFECTREYWDSKSTSSGAPL